MLEGPLAIVVNRHELYEANVIGVMEAQSGEIQNLVIIDPPHHHDIYLYRIEPDSLTLPVEVPGTQSNILPAELKNRATLT